jgi:rubrerythrin
MTAQFELMQKNIVDLLAEVKSESESEAASAGNREREERSELIREQQKKHAQEVKALQSAVRDATAARARLEGAVASMLEDTAKTAVVEVEGQVAELCAAAAENEKVADKAFIGLLERIC